MWSVNAVRVVWAVLPLGMVALAHVNFHVLTKAPFDATRLLLPSVVGIAGAAIFQWVARTQRQLSQALARAEAAYEESRRAAEKEAALLAAAERRLLRLEGEQRSALMAVGAVHDLRNLLTPIKLTSEMLELDAGTNGELSPLIENLRVASEHAALLCNRVLSALVTREAQRTRIAAPSELSALCRRAHRLAAPHGVLLLKLDEGQLDADPDDLLQIMYNLLQNSAKARPGGLKLTVHGRRMAESYVLTIADNGPGLPRNFQPGRLEQVGGEIHGLGLRLVLLLCERNNAELRVESSSSGAVFAVLLPCRTAQVLERPDGPSRGLRMPESSSVH